MELIKRQLSEKQINKIISKCWENTTFKQQLIANPIQAIKQVTGCALDVPEGIQLVINDQTDTGFAHFNIPAQPRYEDVELTEEELDIVSGGTDGPIKDI